MSFTRSAVVAIRAARTASIRPQFVRLSARRGYSSGHGHDASKASSDLPWAIGAVAVTIPSCWYLLKESPEEAHHLHVPHKPEAHVEHEVAEAVEAEEAEKPQAKEEPKEEPKEEAAAEPEAAADDTKKQAGEVNDDVEDGSPKDKAASSKPAGDSNTQSGKQEGLSNADTKTTRDIGAGSGIGQKAEGTPDSSKSKGTVDVHRLQPEDDE